MSDAGGGVGGGGGSLCMPSLWKRLGPFSPNCEDILRSVLSVLASGESDLDTKLEGFTVGGELDRPRLPP